MRMLMEFKKGDTIRYLGLLDLQRTMQRALRRSGLPVAYSNGFNPHIVMAFASALSSGIPGDAEVLDVSLERSIKADSCFDAMKSVLPPDLQPNRIRLVGDRFPKLGKILEYAEYQFNLNENAASVINCLETFMNKRSVMAVRKSKSGEKEVDIIPMIRELHGTMKDDSAGVIQAIVSFTEASTLKPDLLMDTVCRETGIETVPYRVRRKGLYATYQGKLYTLLDYPEL